MAKIYEIKIQPQREYKVCTGRTCDLCGVAAVKSNDYEVDWGHAAKHYSVQETEVKITTSARMRIGNAFPEGGDGVDYEVDICPSCFLDKLIPWLKSQGAAVREVPYDF